MSRSQAFVSPVVTPEHVTRRSLNVAEVGIASPGVEHGDPAGRDHEPIGARVEEAPVGRGPQDGAPLVPSFGPNLSHASAVERRF